MLINGPERCKKVEWFADEIYISQRQAARENLAPVRDPARASVSPPWSEARNF